MTALELAERIMCLPTREQLLEIRVGEWLAVTGVVVRSHHERVGKAPELQIISIVSVEC